MEPAATLERTHLLNGRVILDQPKEGYRVAIDAVLAAAAVPARPGGSVLDAGAGTGAVSLCLAARVPELAITALELLDFHHAIARRNIELNCRTQSIRTQLGNLLDLPSAQRIGYDHVVTNPPYYRRGRHTQPGDSSKAAAGHSDVTLGGWLAACLKRVRSLGSITVVHRADALGDLMTALNPSCGDIEVIPIWPRLGAKQAKRVILRARKGSRGPAKLHHGLILHAQDHSYTEAAEKILRSGAALLGDDQA